MGSVFYSQNMKDKKIAFVHYPHVPDAARLETMPFALNTVLLLAKAGWHVDIFLWEKPNPNYSELFSRGIEINYFQPQSSLLLDRVVKFCERKFSREVSLKFKFSSLNHYHCVFGLGQLGSYVGSLIAKASKCPFILINDEFPSAWSKSLASKLEQEAAVQANYVIVPDNQRFAPLCQELPELSDKPYSMLPNMPLLGEEPIGIDWHSELGIPSDKYVFLHAGSIADWAQVPELLSTVPHWPNDVVLLLQSRSSEAVEHYRKQLSHLNFSERIVWSTSPLPDWKLNSLVAFSTGNFALYRHLGSNIEYVGCSSGKLMRSIAFGSPVIASNFSSFSFIAEHRLGILINHPIELVD